MSAPTAELQRAIHGALSGSSALQALTGPDGIHDKAPENVAFPYITFGQTSIYDWSTGTESGTEQIFTVHVWSKAKGKKEALEIMEAAREALADRELALDGHHLVNLTLEFAEARYSEDLMLHHGVLRFRAVTEPA